MAFRDTEAIDIVADSPERENGVDLLIVETPGDNLNEEERYQLLIQKLNTYVNYVMSQDFAQNFPHTQASNVMIKVFYTSPPNDQMVQITEVGSEIPIPVEFQDFNEIPE